MLRDYKEIANYVPEDAAVFSLDALAKFHRFSYRPSRSESVLQMIALLLLTKFATGHKQLHLSFPFVPKVLEDMTHILRTQSVDAHFLPQLTLFIKELAFPICDASAGN